MDMERFIQLFADFLALVYHCFDRIVIHGYLSGLSRPEQVVYFFRHVLGIPVVSKEILSQRTNDYRGWVEAYARNHKIPMEWAEKGTRKEDYVLPALRRMEKRNAYGVYFIFKSMEQGRTFRSSVPKFPTQDPNHRILAHQRSRFTHYYFYIRDAVLGPGSASGDEVQSSGGNGQVGQTGDGQDTGRTGKKRCLDALRGVEEAIGLGGIDALVGAKGEGSSQE